MRKVFAVLGAVLLLTGLLAGCGTSGNAAGSGSQSVDLTAFWEAEEARYQWGENYFAELDDELMENYYPGIQNVAVRQLITKVPMMSAVVNEMVFAEAETEEDAGKLADILQQRVDDQASGGAWYPESMEAWKKAQVVTNGRYVAMVALRENQDKVMDDFNALFA